MHSWANISHFLDYKSELDIPSELKKDFYALSGLFYVADKHFELFFNQSNSRRENIERKFERVKDILFEEINLYTLQLYLKLRLPDREHCDLKELSALVEEIKATEYSLIQQIEDAFQIGWDAFLIYEKENPPSTRSSNKKYADVGVVRGVLEIVDEKFAFYRNSYDFKKKIR